MFDLFNLSPLVPYAHDYFARVPADELDRSCACEICKSDLTEEAFYDGDSAHYCGECAQGVTEKWFDSATEFAREHCQITSRLPAYDESLEFRCTPEEYNNGSKESYSPNAYLCDCRHNYTNYDELIENLDRFSAVNRVYYHVIRDHLHRLLDLNEDFMREEGSEEQ